MGKYQQDAVQLLELVGGKENIAAVSHCVTRMRFVLNDPKKADVPGIEAMKVTKGTFTQAGQFRAGYYILFSQCRAVSDHHSFPAETKIWSDCAG